MENLSDKAQQQALADEFWQTYFADDMESRIDDRRALEIGLWERLQRALEASEIDTVFSVMLASPAIPIASTDVYTRIVRTAKRVLDAKQYDNPHHNP